MSQTNVPRISRDQVRELDRRAIEEFGVPGVVLMENAGRGAAELLCRLNPDRQPVVILAGPGNNGGDGFVIARHLDNAGWPVEVWYVTKDPAAHRGDLATNYEIVTRSGLAVRQFWGTPFPWPDTLENLSRSGYWFVDALFGTGLTRPLAEPYAELVTQVNACSNSILAIDLPSGLDCDTGLPLGPTVRAAHTATFVAEKIGFARAESREWTGELHVVDIGAPRALVEQYLK